ncbi:hypothetical protein B5X24_HaOG207891 [Helicoverpa armigera]|uniref:FLYWCH-type domain-containing protein n=1 Tax=Helicoverpa armigera TaxID=29058 RepID=A0A2W1BL96_HELAM|nr:hypothetical protein B5X24_HaOG207891 [Helicoverpa armigera]
MITIDKSLVQYLMIDGYVFYKHNQTLKNDDVRWQCTHNCKAHVFVSQDGYINYKVSTHNHPRPVYQRLPNGRYVKVLTKSTPGPKRKFTKKLSIKRIWV